MARIGLKKHVEHFKILLNSIYEHVGLSENQKVVDKIENDLQTMGGYLQIFVDVEYQVDGHSKFERYTLYDATKNGIELPEGVESFSCEFIAKSSTKSGDVVSVGRKNLFKTKRFVVAENCDNKKDAAKRLTNSDIIIKNMEIYQDKTGNRIRFALKTTASV